MFFSNRIIFAPPSSIHACTRICIYNLLKKESRLHRNYILPAGSSCGLVKHLSLRLLQVSAN